MTRRVLVALAVFAALVCSLYAPNAAAEPAARDEKKPAHFGPWDAGDARDVVRQGTKGKARRAHPAVGANDKVPGDGPPPPALRVDPYIPETALDAPNVVGASLSSNPLFLAALVYANFLTKVDGPRCQHLPTCSRFASQAVARHGVLGILMGLDRVIQPPESSALRTLPELRAFGGVRHYDPLENYEFWKGERFTGFPPATPEQPLTLPVLAAAVASSEVSE